MIPYNKPLFIGTEEKYVLESIHSNSISGNGKFTKKCQQWFENKLGCSKALLTPSCTHALEMAALLLDIKPGDEIIMPSFTFVSTANAFVLRGAKIVFVDIRPDTLNIDEKLIEEAITQKTKAIVVVHYAGVACEMDTIMNIAEKHHLYVIEDAAQAMMSTYKNKPLGIIGHIGTYSFHETKNFTSGGEGGLLILNDEKFVQRAEIIQEKGTNRSQFFKGQVDKYSWVDIGSSYLMSDLQAAYLWGQLENVDQITKTRLALWNHYNENLKSLEDQKLIELPNIPSECVHNGHIFYIKVKNTIIRQQLLAYLHKQNILAIFHYIPLHSSTAGIRFGRFHGKDIHTTDSSERIVRLPLYFGLKISEVDFITKQIKEHYMVEI